MSEVPQKSGRSSPSDRPGLKRAGAAFRSGMRRYPRALWESLGDSGREASIPVRDVLAELGADGLAVCWLGHGTVVVELDSHTVVVDPVLSERIGPRLVGRTLGPKRLVEVPLHAESLRGVDLVLITHAHFDHLDKPTLEVIADTMTTIIVPRRCKRLIPKRFGEVIELGAGDEFVLGETSVRAMEPRHWGARTVLDRRRGVCSFRVIGPGGRVLFAGDTADTSEFDGLDPLDLAVFGIGAYKPWDHMHATPEQVWEMFRRSGASRLLPVHHSTFELSDEPVNEPMERLLSAARGESERVVALEPGEVIVLPIGVEDCEGLDQAP